ncbi:MAG: DUF349 domain-containing protein [Xanthomonadales bacterium]|nr:DUF349 domain-containing protein [Xanthomonadales bacterium]
MRKRGVDGLRALDRVNPRERKNLAAELKQVLGIIDERIKAQHTQIEMAKASLVTRAEALAEQSDTRTAMNQARDLQKLWQAAGNGKRARDQAQWKAFRSAIDAVFGRADNERAERTAQDRQAIESAENLCVELEALASTNSAPERGEVQRIESAWRALGASDPALRQRYLAAQDALDKHKTRLDKDKRRARFDIWIAHHDLLRKLKRIRSMRMHSRSHARNWPPSSSPPTACRRASRFQPTALQMLKRSTMPSVIAYSRRSNSPGSNRPREIGSDAWICRLRSSLRACAESMHLRPTPLLNNCSRPGSTSDRPVMPMPNSKHASSARLRECSIRLDSRPVVCRNEGCINSAHLPPGASLDHSFRHR